MSKQAYGLQKTSRQLDELYLLLKKQPQGKPELGLQAISLQRVTIFNKVYFRKKLQILTKKNI